jgi:hypothetical protein
MTKKEYQQWLEEMENKGLDDCEIEAMLQDYLDQPESPEWFYLEGQD